jgi:hypothetical protein
MGLKIYVSEVKIFDHRPFCHVNGLNGRGKPMVSSLSADGFPLMAGPNFQPSDGNPTIISILRQLADGPKNVPGM